MLLSALIVGGRLTKQAAPATVAHTSQTANASENSMLLVHHVMPSEPVKPASAPVQPQQSGNGLLAEMF